MSEENSAVSNALWAMTTLLFVAIMAAALYFGGVFNQEKQMNINIEAPAQVKKTN